MSRLVSCATIKGRGVRSKFCFLKKALSSFLIALYCANSRKEDIEVVKVLWSNQGYKLGENFECFIPSYFMLVEFRGHNSFLLRGVECDRIHVFKHIKSLKCQCVALLQSFDSFEVGLCTFVAFLLHSLHL